MNGIGDGIAGLFKLMFFMLVLFVPLGLWKLIEGMIWFFSHLHWGAK